MILSDLLTPVAVACDVHARSKKHCLEMLSDLLAGTELDREDVFARLVERERLGCTCLNKGIAFPHCRVSGLEAPRGALMKLAKPVEFDAADGDMVDIVFGLMVPKVLDAAHYATIEQLPGLLGDERLRAELAAAKSKEALYEALRKVRFDETAILRSAARD